MTIWRVHACTSALLLVALFFLPFHLTIFLDLHSTPLILKIIMTMCAIAATVAIVVVGVSAVAASLVHIVWVTAGAWCLSRSLEQTWKQAYSGELDVSDPDLRGGAGGQVVNLMDDEEEEQRLVRDEDKYLDPRSEEDRLHMLDLLLRLRKCDCIFRHDRVFRLLTVAKDANDFLLLEDYRTDVDQLSIRMTMSYLKPPSCKTLDIILLGTYATAGDRQPSWCPDYFRFDRLPQDRRLVEYVCESIRRERNSSKDNETGLFNRPLFQASGRSTSMASFEDRVLRSPAYCLGTINSLGWIASDWDMRHFPSSLEQPERLEQKDDDVAAAFWNLLTTLLQRDFWEDHLKTGKPPANTQSLKDFERCESAYTFFMLLVFGSGMNVEIGKVDAEMHRPAGQYTRWLLANQHFRFGHRTLRELADGVASALRHRRFWKWASTLKHVLRASTMHDELRDRARIHEPLKTLLRQNMRLMPLSLDGKDILGLAHPDARVDDKVYLLPGCSVPVIVREIERWARRGPWSVVGDAIVPGSMFGEKWKECTDDELGMLDIV